MKTRLTKSELAVMEVLWDEGEALTSAEIIQKSKEKEWKDSSVHLLINSLLKKKVVTVAGFKKTTKNYARTFVPVEGKEQFLVGQVPVVDDQGSFIGIITRKSIIKYCYNEIKAAQKTAGEEIDRKSVV